LLLMNSIMYFPPNFVYFHHVVKSFQEFNNEN